MKSHDVPAPRLDDEKRKQFLGFIRQVSPSADPSSVMLFGQVMRASNLLEQAAERNLGDAGLTWAKFRLLMNLHRCERDGETEGMQPSELSDVQQVSRNTVSALIRSLEKEGLISRELHGTDHRRFVIRLAPEGRKVLRMKMDSQFKYATHCFNTLSAAERQMLMDLLIRLNQALAEKNK